MITDLLLDLLEGLVALIAGLMPNWDVGAVVENFDLLVGNLTAMNYFLPISEVFAVTVAVLVIFPALMGASLVVWIVALIRGGSARA